MFALADLVIEMETTSAQIRGRSFEHLVNTLAVNNLDVFVGPINICCARDVASESRDEKILEF